MGLDRKTLLTRTLSAFIFVAFMLTGLLWNQWSFFILFLLVSYMCLREYAFLLEEIFKVNFKTHEKLAYIIAGLCIYAFLSLIELTQCNPSLFGGNYLFYFLGFAIGLIGTLLISKNKKARFLLAGIGYCCIPLAFMNQSRAITLSIPLFVIFAIWINDTMAYIGGSLVGKNPLASKISPNKTIEGTASGILFSLIFAIIWYYLRGNAEFALIHWLVLALIASIIGTTGDLVESQLKRWAGVKDSGQMLPGHGGALDRFDSIIFSSSFAFLYAFFFMNCS